MDKFLGCSGQSNETSKRKLNSATDESKVNKKLKTAAALKKFMVWVIASSTSH
ncbi:488_t:CDS:2 [Funneliformis geosporum]|uniref:488_t:CDS:1 n=1 Tax=Funneliformis geosporum TaxID=1117311 RepID=A0A9W4T897_9GLOM|nr:488_t:CDS:2 [Funneliformis geosporum]